MDRYVTQEKPTTIRVLDLAAGSGEATEVSLLLSLTAARSLTFYNKGLPQLESYPLA